jgi:CheY-like chemotaxis protein
MAELNVLIVDDDPEDATFLSDAVKELVPTADCRIAQTAQTARTSVEAFTPHFVFLDAIMYPVGGKEVLREFSQLPPLRETKFIVMSGVILPDQHAEFTSLGANFVMTKPSNYQSLLRFVEHILGSSIINIRVKLFTNDNLIHDQTGSIEKLLGRSIDFEITLNVQPARQNIQFTVSESELQKIRSTLDYNLLHLNGGHWLPNI